MTREELIAISEALDLLADVVRRAAARAEAELTREREAEAERQWLEEHRIEDENRAACAEHGHVWALSVTPSLVGDMRRCERCNLVQIIDQLLK